MNIFDYSESLLAKEIKFREHTAPEYLNQEDMLFIRCDGRSFKNFTRGFKKPFDDVFRNTMEKTMLALCEEIQGCVLGFTQSDEITIMFKKLTPESQIMFGGRKSKIETTAASCCTLFFNKFLMEEVKSAKDKLRNSYLKDEILPISEIDDIVEKEFSVYERKFMTATFDARAFTIPREESAKVLIWRLLDCHKNAIQMVARSHFSNRELHLKKVYEMKEMLLDKGIDVSEINNRYIFGRMALKEEKLLYQGTERECIRNKFTLKDSLETMNREDIFC